MPANTYKAFKELKSVLISEPVVHNLDPTLPYALITEASSATEQNPGAYQRIPGQQLCQLKCHEKNNEMFVLEIADGVMDHYDVYLKEKHFMLYTDNKPVRVLKPVHVKMLHPLEETLQAFDFKIIY